MKFGRKPRGHSPFVPHLSRLGNAQQLPMPPIAVDYTTHLPADLGLFCNDVLSDCTAAAYFHSRQVWTSYVQGSAVTEPDSNVIQLYSESCGYDSSNPLTDQGGVEQDVLAYLLNTGAPVGNGGRDKIIGYIEADVTNLDDIKRIIAECGVAYLGINIPQYFEDDGEAPDVWDYDPKANNSIAGKHAIILASYDTNGFGVISWGQKYTMTNNFFASFTEEAYGIADRSWLEVSGKTPFGMTLTDWENAMAALKVAA